jgi:hypothetical protein
MYYPNKTISDALLFAKPISKWPEYFEVNVGILKPITDNIMNIPLEFYLLTDRNLPKVQVCE